MAYKQNWGMSRSKSPLNNSEPHFLQTQKTVGRSNYKIENDPLNTNIIQANNQNSNKQIFTPGIDQEKTLTQIFTPGIDPKKHLLKQVVKSTAPKASILGKVAKFASKRALGFLDVFLGSQNAYAPPRYDDDHFKNIEKEIQYTNDTKGMSKKQVMEWDNMSEEAKQLIRNSKKLPSKYQQPRHMLSQGN